MRYWNGFWSNAFRNWQIFWCRILTGNWWYKRSTIWQTTKPPSNYTIHNYYPQSTTPRPFHPRSTWSHHIACNWSRWWLERKYIGGWKGRSWWWVGSSRWSDWSGGDFPRGCRWVRGLGSLRWTRRKINISRYTQDMIKISNIFCTNLTFSNFSQLGPKWSRFWTRQMQFR